MFSWLQQSDVGTPLQPPKWARRLLASELRPQVLSDKGEVLVWTVGEASTATISDQFKANAEDYHQRYAASDHFQALFEQALAATAIRVRPKPQVLDLGSGSGVNSVIPCQRLFPGARIVATDLSAELLAILAGYARAEDTCCVAMDAMSAHPAAGRYDLVIGASILHHLERPHQGIAAAGRALKRGGHALFMEPFQGYAVMRLAYERILSEAALRGEGALAPDIARVLAAMVWDIEVRTAPDPAAAYFTELDDKWLFSESQIRRWAADAGFAEVRFVPHNDHPRLYADAAVTQLRLAGVATPLPDWALEVLASYDAAFTLHAKRQMALESTIVLTKG